MKDRRSHFALPWIIWRQVSASAGGSLAVAAIVFALVAIASAVPGAINAVSTDALQYQSRMLPVEQRDLIAGTLGGPSVGPSIAGATLPPASDAVWGRQEDNLASLRSEMRPALRRVVGGAQYFVSLAAALARPADPAQPAPATMLAPSFDPHLSERVTIIDGAEPAPITSPLPSAEPVEIAISAANAARMQLAVGDVYNTSFSRTSQQVRVAGIFEAKRPGDNYWRHAVGSLNPSVLSAGGFEPVITGLAYVDAASWPQTLAVSESAATTAWFPVHPGRMTAASSAQLATGLRAFTRLPHGIATFDQTDVTASVFTRNTSPIASSLSFSSRLGITVDDAAERSATTNAVLAMTASGPIGVAFAVLLLGTRLIARRRSQGLGLAAARGATAGQLRTVLAIEGAAIGLPAAALGMLVGTLLAPGPVLTSALVVSGLIGLTPAVLLATSTSEGSLRRFRSDLGESSPGRRRLLAEVVVLALAVAAVVLLLQRGLTTAVSGAGVDPLLAATPLLIALAACVIVMRLYPIPLSWLTARLSRRRHLSGFVGSARALRDPAAGFAPLLAILVGTAVAVFSVLMLSTSHTGVDDAARATVGADLKITAPYISAESLTTVAGLDGVAGVAPVYVEARTLVTVDDEKPRTLSVLVVDSTELQKVQRGMPSAIQFPAPMDVFGSDGIPVVASSQIAGTLRPDSTVEVEGHRLKVVGSTNGDSPLSRRGDFLIIDRAGAAELGGFDFAPGVAFVDLDPGPDAAAVIAAIRTAVGPDAAIETPATVAAEVNKNPSVMSLSVALALATMITWLLTAAAVVMTLVANAPARERVLSLLRALGLGRRQTRAIVGWEIGPIAGAALAAGVPLGLALPWVVLAGVDLRPFTSGVVQPTVTSDPLLLLAVLGGFALVLLASTAAAMAAARRADPARILRTIEEG